MLEHKLESQIVSDHIIRSADITIPGNDNRMSSILKWEVEQEGVGVEQWQAWSREWEGGREGGVLN